MSNFSPPSRRSFLMASGAGVALTGVAMTFHANSKEAAVKLDKYQPEYFTSEEWAFVLAATARLIPSEGEGPGALEAHVPVFIDRQLKGYYGNADIWYMQGPHDPTATQIVAGSRRSILRRCIARRFLHSMQPARNAGAKTLWA